MEHVPDQATGRGQHPRPGQDGHADPDDDDRHDQRHQQPQPQLLSGGGPISNAGTVSTGNSSSTAVVIRPTPARADATAAARLTRLDQQPAWTTPPVAAPPGTTLLAALPASCALATVPHAHAAVDRRPAVVVVTRRAARGRAG